MSLAGMLDMDLKLLMVLETRHTFFYPMTSPLKTGIASYEFEKIREERLKEEKKQMSAFVDKLNSRGAKIKVDFEIRSGATDMILLEASGKKDTYMLMINESEEPEMGFLINTYLQIVEKTECPILKVNGDFDFSKLQKVLYATDYKEEDVPVLKKLSEMLAPFKAEITALHITDNLDLEEKLKSHGYESSLLKKIGYDRIRFAIRKDKKVPRGIMDYAKSGKYDMIVVLKENRSFLERIFGSSDSNKILAKAETPVMVYHEENV